MFNKIIGFFTKDEKTIGKNTLILFIAKILSSLLPAVTIIILGRSLGKNGIGLIYGMLALVLLFYPFSDFGYSQIIIREISRNRDKAVSFISRGLGFVFASSIPFFIIILTLSKFIGKFPFFNALILTISYIFLHSFIRVWNSAFQGIEKMEFIAFTEISDKSILLIGVLILSIIGNLNVINVVYTYLISGFITSLLSFLLGFRIFGFIKFKPQLITKNELIESSHFSLNSLGGSIYYQQDKVMLSKLSTLGSVGTYTFAQKVCNVFINILGSFLMSTYPRFFKLGVNNKKSFLKFSKRASLIVMTFGLLSAILLFFTAPFIVKVMGTSFEESILAIKILSIYPLLKGLSFVIGDILTGSGYQKRRMQITWFGVFINFLLNLILIIKFGWIGAAIATLGTYLLINVLELAFIKLSGIFNT